MDAKLNSPRDADAGAREAAIPVVIRNSRDSDVPAMLAIYLHHIRRGVDPGVDTGEFETPDTDDLKRRRKSMNRRKMPHLVAEEGGTVVGYLPAVGYKFGHWTDTVMVQRSLGPGATEPPAK